ncbi:unnamed protein product, partial [Effrenium voratum]
DRAPLLSKKDRMELPPSLQKLDEEEVCTTEIRAQQAALRQKKKEDCEHAYDQ